MTTPEDVKEKFKAAYQARVKMNATSETQPADRVRYEEAKDSAEQQMLFCAIDTLNDLSHTAHQFGFGNLARSICDARDIVSRAIVAQKKKEEERQEALSTAAGRWLEDEASEAAQDASLARVAPFSD